MTKLILESESQHKGNKQTRKCKFSAKCCGFLSRNRFRIDKKWTKLSPLGQEPTFKSLDNWDCLWNEFSLADDKPTEIETSSIELLIGNDYYLDIILPQKVEVQSGLYMLCSKLGWILSGRTSEIVENSTESSMLIMTHGKGIDNETTFLTCLDKSLPMKPNLEDF